jgi:hypothetical protein
LTDPSDQMPWLSRYERSKSLGMYWYNKASDLHGTAGLVWAGMEDDQAPSTAVRLGLGKGFDFRVACWPVYLMLCGLALELLLKTAIVAKGAQPTKTHQLEVLWERVGLPLTAKEQGLLKILTESILWAGRYPVPTREADFDRLADLQWEHLWSPSSNRATGLDLRHPNGNLDWPAFGKLWSVVQASPAITSLFDSPIPRRKRRRGPVTVIRPGSASDSAT